MEEEKIITPINFEENSLNLREELEKYLYYWKWILLSLIITISLAFLYLRYTQSIYSASITVLVNENANSGNGLSGTKDINFMFGGRKGVTNEIELFKSRTNFINVIKNLDLDVKYFSEGNILTTENYNTSPIKAIFIEKDTLVKEQTKEINSSNFIVKGLSSEEFQLLDINKKEIGKFRYNDTISKYNMIIRLTSKKPDSFINKEIIVKKVFSNITLASIYRNKLQIKNVKGTSILTMSIKDKVRNKAIDILNELVDVYNKENLEYTNETYIRTADFIDERLKLIKIELSEVEDDAEDFKRKNRLIDIPAEGQISLQGSSEYDMKIAEVETEISVLNFVKESLDNNQSDFLPEIVDVSDSKTSSLITGYNELMATKKRLLSSSTEKNPAVVNINNEIKILKNSIENSISNLNSSLSIRKSALIKEGNKFKGRMSSVPKYENVFRDIQRNQVIKENLYVFLLQRREQTQIALSSTELKVRIIDSAYGNKGPISPRKRNIYMTALGLGLLLPIGLLYLKFLLDNKVQSRKDIEKVIKAPILGDIPKSRSKKKVVVSDQDRDATAESFRLLRTNIDFMLSKINEKSKVIYVSSTLSGEGKTFISINLAAALSLTSKKVLLIGADIRKPKITDYLDVKEGKGLTHFLMDNSLKVPEVIDTIEEHNFDMLHSGIIAPNPSELLMNGRFNEVIKYGKANYDYVIVDTAPVNLVTDTLLLSDHADLFIYVTRAGYLDKRLLDIPKNLYENKRLPNMAILLNDTDAEKGYGYGYGYGYGGYDAYGEDTSKKKWWQLFSNN